MAIFGNHYVSEVCPRVGPRVWRGDMEKATFAGGCFWGVEHLFNQVPGVIEAVSGYEGGTVDHPTYEQVCMGRTGHGEAVEVTYDPSKVSYEQLLNSFWNMHDPTTLNRQGPDMGHQYRSVIFFHSPEQEKAALKSEQEAQKFFDRKIVTEIVPATDFWRAEDYHQRYFEKHPGQHKIHEFRWAFAVGLAGIALLYVAGLITAAILVATFLVPVLYLIYLYEAQVYRDEPAIVLGFTIGGGAVIGLVLTLIERAAYNPFPAVGNPLTNIGVSVGTLLFLGLLVPVVQEALKPLPALFLPNRLNFPETVDGLVFGVAAGLGFSVAESLVAFSSALTSLPAHLTPGNWIFDLTTLAVFQPLLQGSATGLIVPAGLAYRR